MEKIAFKNNLQGGQNTYEIQYGVARQLFGAMSKEEIIGAGDEIAFYVTSQPINIQYNLATNINVNGITLYFSQGKEQTLNIRFANDNVDENFYAPNGGGSIYLPLDTVWDNSITQRVIITNTEVFPSNPEPRLVSWCLEYSF